MSTTYAKVQIQGFKLARALALERIRHRLQAQILAVNDMHRRMKQASGFYPYATGYYDARTGNIIKDECPYVWEINMFILEYLLTGNKLALRDAINYAKLWMNKKTTLNMYPSAVVASTGDPLYGTYNLEWHAHEIWGLVQLYRVTGDSAYLAEASKLADAYWQYFYAAGTGLGYFKVDESTGSVVATNSCFFDNTHMLYANAVLYRFTGNSVYLSRAKTILTALDSVRLPNGQLPNKVDPVNKTYVSSTSHYQALAQHSINDVLAAYMVTGDADFLNAAKAWMDAQLAMWDATNNWLPKNYDDNGTVTDADTDVWVYFLTVENLCILYKYTGITDYLDKAIAFHNKYRSFIVDGLYPKTLYAAGGYEAVSDLRWYRRTTHFYWLYVATGDPTYLLQGLEFMNAVELWHRDEYGYLEQIDIKSKRAIKTACMNSRVSRYNWLLLATYLNDPSVLCTGEEPFPYVEDIVFGHAGMAKLEATSIVDPHGLVDPLVTRTMLHIRPSVLRWFTNPKVLVATTSMRELLTSADKVEAAAGNISATSQELTIIGGTSTSTGDSWIYWNLPEEAKRIYIRAKLCSVDADAIAIEVCNGDASTKWNPPDLYNVYICVPALAADFRVDKVVAGTGSNLGYEAVDLNYNTFYDVEFYVDVEKGRIIAWRDGKIKVDVSDTDITTILAARIRVHDGSTTTAQSGKVRGPVVIIYE